MLLQFQDAFFMIGVLFHFFKHSTMCSVSTVAWTVVWMDDANSQLLVSCHCGVFSDNGSTFTHVGTVQWVKTNAMAPLLNVQSGQKMINGAVRDVVFFGCDVILCQGATWSLRRPFLASSMKPVGLCVLQPAIHIVHTQTKWKRKEKKNSEDCSKRKSNSKKNWIAHQFGAMDTLSTHTQWQWLKWWSQIFHHVVLNIPQKLCTHNMAKAVVCKLWNFKEPAMAS